MFNPPFRPPDPFTRSSISFSPRRSTARLSLATNYPSPRTTIPYPTTVEGRSSSASSNDDSQAEEEYVVTEEESQSMPSTEIIGRLNVKVVEARGLQIDDQVQSKPYVLLQYDRTDSITLAYGEAGTKDGESGGIRGGGGGGSGNGNGIRRIRPSTVTGSNGDSSSSSQGITVRRRAGNSTIVPSSTTTTTSSSRNSSGGSESSSSSSNIGPSGTPSLWKATGDTLSSKGTFSSSSPPSRTQPLPQLIPSTSDSNGSHTPSISTIPPSAEIGSPDSPKWNHSTTFDVVARNRTLLICVYDKLPQPFPSTTTTLKSSPLSQSTTLPQDGDNTDRMKGKRRRHLHGFLGAGIYEPLLNEDEDVWVPLRLSAAEATGPVEGVNDDDVAKEDDENVGEVRLKISFEPLASRTSPTINDFQVLRRIGQGSFGSVYLIRKRDTKRIYALKVIDKSRIASRRALLQVFAERQVLAITIDSPFLVSLKFSFQSKENLFFVIDYRGGGELFQHLQRDGGRFEESKVKFYLGEIVLALEYLHARGIVYRDLKPENILLDLNGHVVLTDFGLSKILEGEKDHCTTLCGTTSFLAPEVLIDDSGYAFPADWWSFGVLLFEMAYGFPPFYAETAVEEYEKILNKEIKLPNKAGYSNDLKDLVLKLLNRDPLTRIGSNHGASEIKQHPFFSSLSFTHLASRQLSPPFKPPALADADNSDYFEPGKNGELVFGGGGGWQNANVQKTTIPKSSLVTAGDGNVKGGANGEKGADLKDSSSCRKDDDRDGFRDFSWDGKEAPGSKD